MFYFTFFLTDEKIDVHAVTSFFKRNNKDKGLLDKPDVAPHSHQEVRGGIPIHFQNDGSPLYLLTYALSPPSLDSVSQFVSKLTQGNMFVRTLKRKIYY